MSPQAQQKKETRLININTVVTGACTAALLWVGGWQVKMYNAWVMQPKINEQQTAAIVNIIQDIKELRAATDGVKNEQTKFAGRLIYLEAIMPDKNQFKVK